ncbi:MAG: hypothetical protein WAO95_10215 [Burkholderiales bacterium]
MRRLMVVCAFWVAALAAGGAQSHGGHQGAHAFGASGDPRAAAFGRPGDSAKVSRVVPVEMDDRECRVQPLVRIRLGDTVRFAVRNAGTRMHELVIGTSHEIREHATEAPADEDADHDQYYILHVEPGAQESLVWRFTRVDLLGYGCLIHGSGRTAMNGRIVVER